MNEKVVAAAVASLAEELSIDFPEKQIAAMGPHWIRVSLPMRFFAGRAPERYKEQFDAACARVQKWHEDWPSLGVIVTMIVTKDDHTVTGGFREVIDPVKMS